jgi:hypothetical protein
MVVVDHGTRRRTRPRPRRVCALALALCHGERRTPRPDARLRRPTANAAPRQQRAERLAQSEANAARNATSVTLDARLEAARPRAVAEAQAAALAAEAALGNCLHQRSRSDQHRDTAPASRARERTWNPPLIAAAFAERRIEPRAARAGIVARALAAPGLRNPKKAAAAASAYRSQARYARDRDRRLNASVLAEAQAAHRCQERGRHRTTLPRAAPNAAQTQPGAMTRRPRSAEFAHARRRGAKSLRELAAAGAARIGPPPARCTRARFRPDPPFPAVLAARRRKANITREITAPAPAARPRLRRA